MTRKAATPQERALFETAGLDCETVLLLSGSTVDVGSWFGRSRLWLACHGDALLLMAAGRRPHVARVPLADAGRSFFNAVTGELVLLPAPTAHPRAVRLTPPDALALLARLRTQRDDGVPSAGSRSPSPTHEEPRC